MTTCLHRAAWSSLAQPRGQASLAGIAASLMLCGSVAAQTLPTPTFGSIEIGPDVAGAIETLPIEAGGPDQASAFGSDCVGSVNAEAPDVVVRLTGPASRLSIFATADTDVTMAVRRPNGSFLCSDDARGLNPAVTLLKPAAGDYGVWVGTIGPDLAAADVHVSLQEPDWDAVLQPALPAAPVADLPQGPASFATLNAQDLAIGRTVTINLAAGGADPASDYSSSCAGFIASEAPDVAILAGADFGALALRVRSDGDTTLVVREPDGRLACDDDSLGVDPSLYFDDIRPGTYAIWVGAYETTVVDAQIEITRGSAAPQAPGRQPLVLAPTPDAEAARIGARVIDALDSMIGQIDPLGDLGVQLTTSAPVEARTDGNRTVVDLPDLALQIDSLRLGLGSPRIEVSPLQDNRLDWAATLPAAIELSDAGTPLGSVTWSEGALGGVMGADDRLPPVVELRLADLVYRSVAAGDAELGARMLRMWSDFAPSEGGLYSGDAGLQLEGLAISNSDRALRVGQIALRSAIIDGDPALVVAGDDLVAALAQGQPIGAALSPFLSSPWGQAETLIELQDVDARTAEGEGLSFQRLRLGSGFDGREQLGSLSLSWGIEGLAVQHPDWPQTWDKSELVVALRLGNLPVRELLELASFLDIAGPDAIELFGLQALGVLIGAGPIMDIEDLRIAAGASRLQGTGSFRLSGGLAGEGSLDLVVQGLPDLIGQISQGQVGGPEAQRMLPVLLMLRGLGNPVSGSPEGGLSYKIELAPDMSVLVNGVDVQGLMK